MSSRSPVHQFCVLLLLVLLTAPLSAQQPSEEEMQRMMESGMQMANCMQEVDESALERMQARGEAFEKEVSALCRAGKRDEAMARAIAWGKEMAADPAMAKIKQCGEMMKGMMPGKVPFDPGADDAELCDHMD